MVAIKNFCILIPQKIWYDGGDHKALMAVLEKFGPLIVDVYTSQPYVKLWPADSAVDNKLPLKKWIYKNGKIHFLETSADELPFEIFK